MADPDFPVLTAVFSSARLGGSELFNLDFLRRARERGAHINAIVPGEGALLESLEPVAQHRVVVPVPRSLAALSRFDARPSSGIAAGAGVLDYARRLSTAIRRYGGALCCMGFRAQLGAALAAPIGRRCWLVHEVVPPGPASRLWSVAAGKADRILAFSHAAANQRALRGRAELQRVRMDLSRFAALAPPPAMRTVGLVGDLFPLKNHAAAVDVVRRLRVTGLDVTALLVGREVSDSPKFAAYAREVKRVVATSDGAAELTSTHPESMPTVMERIDVLLQLSTVPESFGRVAVEAMAAGRPVVAFAHGALTEIVVDDHTGKLVPPGDLTAVRDAVAGLVTDPERLSTWSRQARRHALERFGDARGHEASIGDLLYEFALATSTQGR